MKESLATALCHSKETAQKVYDRRTAKERKQLAIDLLRDNFNKTKLLATYLRTVENRSSLIDKRSKDSCFALSNSTILQHFSRLGRQYNTLHQ